MHRRPFLSADLTRAIDPGIVRLCAMTAAHLAPPVAENTPVAEQPPRAATSTPRDYDERMKPRNRGLNDNTSAVEPMALVATPATVNAALISRCASRETAAVPAFHCDNDRQDAAPKINSRPAVDLPAGYLPGVI